LLVALILLSACRGGDSTETPGGNPPVAEPSGSEGSNGEMETAPDATTLEPEVPEPAEPVESALEQYRTIVNQEDTYDYGNEAMPDGYRYALVQMQADDAVPLVCFANWGGYSPPRLRLQIAAKEDIPATDGMGGPSQQLQGSSNSSKWLENYTFSSHFDFKKFDSHDPNRT